MSFKPEVGRDLLGASSGGEFIEARGVSDLGSATE